MDAGKKERKKTQPELYSLMEKYEEMVKKMGTSSSVDQSLTSTDLPYSAVVMVTPLSPKIRVPKWTCMMGLGTPSST